MKGICKACELLDKDHSIKEVKFCKVCEETLCEPCEKNLLRRAKAALKQLTNKK